MTTRSKNATQHPGHAVKPPRIPANADGKTTKDKKADAAKAKAAKAVAKKLGAAQRSKFEQEATPRPNFTPAAGRTLAPSSKPNAAESVLESEVDTDEANPDKATYQLETVSDDDTPSSLSAIPTSKMSYAEAASPKRKGRAVVGKPAGRAPAKMKAVEASMSDSATELDFPPLSPTQPKAFASTPKIQQTTTTRKAFEAPGSDSATEPDSPLLQPQTTLWSKGQKTTTSKRVDQPDFPPTRPKVSASKKAKVEIQQTTTARKAVEAPSSDSATEPDSPLLQPQTAPRSKTTSKKRVDTVSRPNSLPTTAPSQALNPKTPAPSKLKRKRVVLPEASETEPDSPPPEPKQGSLQRTRGYRDLGDILHQPVVVHKQKRSR